VGARIVAVVVFTVLAAASVLGVVVGYTLAADRLRGALDRGRVWLEDNNHVVMAMMLLVMGAVGFFSGVGRCGGAVRVPGRWRLPVLSVPPVLGRHRVERLLRFPVALVEDPDHPIGAEVVFAWSAVAAEGEPERRVHAFLLEHGQQILEVAHLTWHPRCTAESRPRVHLPIAERSARAGQQSADAVKAIADRQNVGSHGPQPRTAGVTSTPAPDQLPTVGFRRMRPYP
jgi:hypothetical protein